MSNELDINEIAIEAYTYLYPLVMMEVTRRHIAVHDKRTEQQKKANLFLHNHRMANDKWRSVARSNFDTLFSAAWIDLTDGPTTISFPSAGDRYHMFQMLDMWTDTYAVVGTRTLGNDKKTVTLVGPNHSGTHRSTSNDIVIHCPTHTTWVIGRSYAQNGPDLDDAIAFVDAIVGHSESEHLLNDFVHYPHEISGKVPPVTLVRNLTAQEFFEFASEIVNREGVRNTDGSQLLRMRSIGFIPGEEFNFSKQSTQTQDALLAAPLIALQRIKHLLGDRRNLANGWSSTDRDIGTYGNSYLLRAAIAFVGLAANPNVDAVYIGSVCDAEGESLNGSNTYLLHFNPGELPPAHAFWSITAYDHEGFMMTNRLNRFGIRSKDHVEFNPDGSLDLYFAPECPSMAPESNWIPSLAGPVALQFRLYSPAEAYINGSWQPPAIQRI